jgi:hypothetical protein
MCCMVCLDTDASQRQPHPSVNPPPQPSTSFARENASVGSLHQNDICWVENFSVPWDRLPVNILKQLKANKRPSNDDKLAVIRFIV